MEMKSLLIYAFLSAVVIFSKPLQWWDSHLRLNESQNQPTRRSGVTTMKRAVGYCKSVKCEDHAKGTFLLNHGDNFFCPKCRENGHVEAEKGHRNGNSDVFKEVRVEYNFCSIKRMYQETAIVRDESIMGRCDIYTLQSPMIRTERRALKVAEVILGNLNRHGLGRDGIPKTTETVLSFDDSLEDFKTRLVQLKVELDNSQLIQRARRR